MKFNVFYTLKGHIIIEVPNADNPVSADDLKTATHQVAEGLPENGLVEVIGVRIEKVE